MYLYIYLHRNVGKFKLQRVDNRSLLVTEVFLLLTDVKGETCNVKEMALLKCHLPFILSLAFNSRFTLFIDSSYLATLQFVRRKVSSVCFKYHD